MKYISQISISNLIHKPLRTVTLILLVMFLSITIFTGSVIISGLNLGLNHLSSRLGADIIVVPYQEVTSNSIEGILIQGKPGYFYMNKRVLDQIGKIEGVDLYTPQFYLASIVADCCSARVQLIGFDSKTDFVVTPWLNHIHKKELLDNEAIVGKNIFVPEDGYIYFYEKKLKVIGKLDNTGTEVDNAVYCNNNTIKSLLKASIDLGRNKNIVDPDNVISSVFIKVKPGFDIDLVLGKINSKVRKIKAIKTEDMVSSVSKNINNVSMIIKILTVIVWILALVVLVIAFLMITNERKKEFAVLRIIGLTKISLAKIVFYESTIICIVGSVLGILLSCLILFSFKTVIEISLDMPFYIDDMNNLILNSVIAIFACVIVGSLVASIVAFKVVKTNPCTFLR